MNLSSYFELVGAVKLCIAFTLSGSIDNPSFETMCPNSIFDFTAKANLAGLSFSLVSRHLCSQSLRWNKCFALSLATLKSSMKTFKKSVK